MGFSEQVLAWVWTNPATQDRTAGFVFGFDTNRQSSAGGAQALDQPD